MEEPRNLVFSRKVGKSFVIDETTIVTVLAVRGNTVKLGIVSPLPVDRDYSKAVNRDKTIL